MFDILMAVLAGVVAYFVLTDDGAISASAPQPLEGGKVGGPRAPKTSGEAKKAEVPRANRETQISPMMTQLRQSITDKAVRERLLVAEKNRNPHLSEDDCIKIVLDSFYKDRR